jgi:hypothetical protein
MTARPSAHRTRRDSAAPEPAPEVPEKQRAPRGGTRMRVAIAICAVLVLGAAAGSYVRHAAVRSGAGAGPVAAQQVSLRPGAELAFRSTADGSGYGHLAVVGSATPTGTRSISAEQCARVYAAGGRGVCLQPSGTVGTYQVAVLNADAQQLRTLPIAGIPSRARVSTSGRMVSWTVFVTGDSYNGGQFSTRSGILDLGTNNLVTSLETFTVTVDGRRYQSQDLNFWGTTFAADDNTFYATMSTKGHRYLVRGDFAAKTVTTLRDNVECPSLSPDQTRLAFKKRVSGDQNHPWRLYVLDLSTLAEHPLADARSVDDQAAWLDDSTVMYGIPRGDARHADVWAVPADGTGTPRVLIPDADSPGLIR